MIRVPTYLVFMVLFNPQNNPERKYLQNTSLIKGL